MPPTDPDVDRYPGDTGITLGDVLSPFVHLIHVLSTLTGLIIISITRRFSQRPNPLCSLIITKGYEPGDAYQLSSPPSYDYPISQQCNCSKGNTANGAAALAIYQFNPPHLGCVKGPDICLRIGGQTIPFLVTESSWPEVYQKLKADMEIWMLGTGLETRIASLVNFDRRRDGFEQKPATS